MCLAVSQAVEEVLIRRCSTDEYYNTAEERGQNRKRKRLREGVGEITGTLAQARRRSTGEVDAI